jgi:hypothetical protein
MAAEPSQRIVDRYSQLAQALRRAAMGRLLPA